MPCIFYEGILLSKGGRKFISVEKPKEVEYEIKYLSLSLSFSLSFQKISRKWILNDPSENRRSISNELAKLRAWLRLRLFKFTLTVSSSYLFRYRVNCRREHKTSFVRVRDLNSRSTDAMFNPIANSWMMTSLSLSLSLSRFHSFIHSLDRSLTRPVCQMARLIHNVSQNDKSTRATHRWPQWLIGYSFIVIHK